MVWVAVREAAKERSLRGASRWAVRCVADPSVPRHADGGSASRANPLVRRCHARGLVAYRKVGWLDEGSAKHYDTDTLEKSPVRGTTPQPQRWTPRGCPAEACRVKPFAPSCREFAGGVVLRLRAARGGTAVGGRLATQTNRGGGNASHTPRNHTRPVGAADPSALGGGNAPHTPRNHTRPVGAAAAQPHPSRTDPLRISRPGGSRSTPTRSTAPPPPRHHSAARPLDRPDRALPAWRWHRSR